jgi:two-component system, NtrC family, sensor kinase
MERIKASILFSFRAKVIVPVVAVMVLLMAMTVSVVNRRITEQFETEARRTLAAADTVVRSSQKIRTRNSLIRFRSLPNEPRYRAAFQTLDSPTLQQLLKDLIGEQNVDVAFFIDQNEKLLATARRDPLLPLADFQSASALAARRALQGEEMADTIGVGERLYDVVSIPVSDPGGLLGVLTLGMEIGPTVAQEFSPLNYSQIALLANGHVSASTLSSPEVRARFTELFKEFSGEFARTDSPLPVKRIEIDGQHYFCSAGQFSSLSSDGTLGYLLLSSYEQPLRALHGTQQLLLGVSLFAILAGSAVVWFLISKVTAPLRELADTAEAVGRGDFSRRVEVRSQDECGELADVFNRMTESLKNSREQLEHTVESLKTTQAQLIQSEKLSGIGEFVAGVAHELNNPLTSVIGFSELLRQGDQEPKHRRYVDTILKSAQRCQKIVQSLLSFARRHQPERKPVCLNALVEAALEILQYHLRTSNIEIITSFDPKLPQAMVDPHQIQQVFLNLINNARQAIEAHQPKGWIKITTEARGENVRVSIQDNGPGISQENLSKIFDPFFTTKEIGKGTGLGLSLCYGIIKEHAGTIVPRSRSGEGATFIIELPVTHVAEEPRANEPRLPQMETVDPREGAGKKVLVIDDEEPILEMVRDTLIPRGYHVDVASDGETGLRRLSETQYDVTLCDWKMPGLNGKEVYEQLRVNNHPQSERIIFITGDVINEQTRRFLEERKRICLPKPFTLAEFRSALGKALAAA